MWQRIVAESWGAKIGSVIHCVASTRSKPNCLAVPAPERRTDPVPSLQASAHCVFHQVAAGMPPSSYQN
jgi:hypothetical protein